jgi:excisionase family DNA binding protein
LTGRGRILILMREQPATATAQRGDTDMDRDVYDDRELVSIREAARLLNIGRSTTYELLRAGKLQSVKIGRRRGVTRRSVRKLAQPAG